MTVPSASAALPTHAESRGRFHGTKSEYRRILWRDMFALIITLGLYRFWVTNNIRRYLWSRTELAGQQLDYNGDPKELLIGFLFLLVALAPVIVLTAMLGWITGIAGGIPDQAVLALLIPLSVLALYQARRYRLNHTMFRGLCFRQTGSAWIFVLRSVLWAVVVVLTLGFAYPWARVDIERYKMRHTWYADIQGSFESSGWELFKRGAFIWIALLPLLLPTLFMLFSDAVTVPDAVGWLLLAAMVIVALIVYPFLRAKVVRWRIAGMRFGPLSFEANFSTSDFVKPYFRFYGWMALLALVVGLLALIFLFIQPVIVGAMASDSGALAVEIIGAIVLLILYFSIATIVTFAFQGTVRFETWRLIVDALVIRGADQLARARAPPAVDRAAGRTGAAVNLGGF